MGTVTTGFRQALQATVGQDYGVNNVWRHHTELSLNSQN